MNDGSNPKPEAELTELIKSAAELDGPLRRLRDALSESKIGLDDQPKILTEARINGIKNFA